VVGSQLYSDAFPSRDPALFAFTAEDAANEAAENCPRFFTMRRELATARAAEVSGSATDTSDIPSRRRAVDGRVLTNAARPIHDGDAEPRTFEADAGSRSRSATVLDGDGGGSDKSGELAIVLVYK
jgi:hypothetical protein